MTVFKQYKPAFDDCHDLDCGEDDEFLEFNGMNGSDDEDDEDEGVLDPEILVYIEDNNLQVDQGVSIV